MKKVRSILLGGLMWVSVPAEAQFLKKIADKAEQAAERAILKKTDEQVTQKTDQAIDGIFMNGTPSTSTTEAPSSLTPENSTTQKALTTSEASDKTWSKYNFVPGEEVIFEDNLSQEENGEFPSRWDLITGSAEIASLSGEQIILLTQNSIIAPLMEKKEYLPEIFTLEFDAYFNDTYSYWQDYEIRFFPGGDLQKLVNENYIIYPLRVNKNGASIKQLVNNEFKEFKNQGPDSPDGFSGWKHISISYNQRAFKVFINEDRILNIPNIDLAATTISIDASNSQKEHIRAVKNIRIAAGGKKLYDRIVADGKFITRGILFDINKASLKPESMGVINEISAFMKEHVDLKFSIEGHTDNDGEEAHNLSLSNQRAQTVKDILIDLGIDNSRLQAKGMGEKVPVSDNNSPEGKANNRRVEFIKI